jgi:hypothetical protein
LRTIAFVAALVSNGTGKAVTETSGQVSRFGKAGQSGSCRQGGVTGKLLLGKSKGNRGQGMKTKDKSRKWLWWFLGVAGAFQLYFVRELVAAFALFAAVFAVFGVVIASLYMLQKSWAVAVEQVAESSHPVVALAKRSMNAVEDLARRPLRRPGSAAAQ